MTKNFYLSYTYDLTNTLQVNMTRPPYTELQGDSKMTDPHNGYNLMFVWNHHLLKSGFSSVSTQSSWVLPMIYGFVDQASTCLPPMRKVFTKETSSNLQSVARNICSGKKHIRNSNRSQIKAFCRRQILEARS